MTRAARWWREFLITTGLGLYLPPVRRELDSTEPCTFCDGQGWVYIDTTKRDPRDCPECGE